MRQILLSPILISMLFACGGGGGSGDDTTPDAPTLSGDKYSLDYGPIQVQPGEENTKCIQLRLSNDVPIKVHDMHNVLSPVSHHMIVYRDDSATEEITTPFDCQPFAGALNPSGQAAPIMITQRSDDPLYMPEGVAYTFAAHQMIRIEMHYINATDTVQDATATVEFYAADESTIHDEANIMFIGSPDIDIPAGATVSVDQFFTPSRASLDTTGMKFFAITGHEHQMGTHVLVQTADDPAGTMTTVYDPDPFEWDEPATVTHSPEFEVPSGLKAGFHFKCDWTNTGNQNIQFGESANDEMCFFWAYYYPSNGSHVCVHTEQFGGVDLCCPDAGAQLCDMLNQ